jgi:uncharacterized repeat protein (TIGR01451 family)
LCNGESNGTIDLTVTGGTPPYSYNWDNGATTQDLTGLSAGVYRVTITDNNGCTATIQRRINEPDELTVTTGGDQEICPNETVTIIASAMGGTMPYSYNWNTGSTASQLNNVGAGTYIVTVTDANNCMDVATTTVTESATPNLVIAGPDEICADELAMFTVTPVLSGATYSWTFNGPATPSTASGSAASTTYSAAGTYNVQVSVTTPDGCSGTTSTSIVVRDAVDADAGSDQAICEGGSTTLDGSNSIGNDFNWTILSGDPTSIDGGSNSATIDVSPLFNTTYQLTVRDASGVCVRSDEVTITIDVDQNPTADAAVAESEYCTGADVILDASGSAAPVSDPNATLNYLWYEGDPSVGGTLLGTGEMFTVNPTTTTEYFVITTVDGSTSTCTDTASVTVNIIPCVDVNLTKVVDNKRPNIGDNVNFTIQVCNEGPDRATGVRVTDELPSGYTFVSASSADYNSATGVWNARSIDVGTCKTLVITAEVLGSGDYVNIASVTRTTERDIDSTPNNDPDTDGDGNIGSQDDGDPDDVEDPDDEDDADDAEVLPLQVDLNLTKVVNNTRPNIGDNVVFTIEVCNEGPDNATGIEVTDQLPSGYTFVSSNRGSYNATTGIWNAGNLDANTCRTLTITATVLGTGDYLNIASITDANETDIDSTPGNDPDTDNDGNIGSEDDGDPDDMEDPDDEDDADDAEVLPLQVDLNLTKIVNNTRPNIGENVTFTIEVCNEGPDRATGVHITDQLPSGYTFVSSNRTSYNETTGVWTAGTFDANTCKTLTIVATVLGSGDYLNIAAITDANETDIDSTPGNDPDTDGDGNIGSEDDGDPDDVEDPDDEDDADDAEVQPLLVDLNLTKVVNNSTPNVGENVTFTIRVCNEGPDNGTGIEVTDELPSGYTFVSASPSNAYNATTNIWTVGDIGANDCRTLNITATVLGSGDYLNIASITDANETDIDSTPGNDPDTDGDGNIGSEDDGDPDDMEDPDDEDDADDAEVTPKQIDLNLTKVVSNTTPDIGENVNFTIRVCNEGPDDATGVEVTDQLPSGYTFVSTNQTSYNNTTGIWMLGNLEAGGCRNLFITASVNAQGEYLNIAAITDANEQDIDSTPGNDPDTDGDGNIGSEDDGDPNDEEDPDDEDDADDAEVMPRALGAIGNYVWIDENSDGFQNAGEPGIPNVIVQLKDGSGAVIATTVTGSNGEYLFPNLPAGAYFVDIDESSLPNAELTQTTIFTNNVDGDDADTVEDDGDLGNKDHSGNGYPITLDAGEENLTADFGYNYNETPDVNEPPMDALAAIGDRVWIDSDGDGVQDPNEQGVEGVEVTLTGAGDDGIFGTTDDVTATTTTDENGYYIFTDLVPGAYVTEVTDDEDANYDVLDANFYDQTGDPDDFGEVATNPDNQQTNPVVLAPGDVFLNSDYGYQPTPANNVLSALGDYVWYDADRDGDGPLEEGVEGGGPIVQGPGGNSGADPDEYGIAGVTVTLIRDLNENRTWDAGEPIIATDVTDEDGFYYFPDLTADNGVGTNDYVVWVSDTDNVLDGLEPTADSDSFGNPPSNDSGAPIGQSTNAVLGISSLSIGFGVAPNAGRLGVDFGYVEAGQDDNEGLIGDYVWFDDNRDGVQDDDEPGVEGVVVELLDDMGNVIATTETNENGYYYFGDLPLDESYQVVIADENFDPNGVLEGFENTFDPDGDTDNEGDLITLTTADPINLDQDFGYAGDDAQMLGSIGNKVFEDPNANGINNSFENDAFEGVTLDLYRDLNGDGEINPGEPRVATTTTDMDGMYLFDELPFGDYIVDVTDEAGILNGYWQSIGSVQNPYTNINGDTADDPFDRSKEDAFAVTIGGTRPANNLNVDFGYYKDPAALGNYVWVDSNANGLQDDGETGLNDVQVTLTIEYPDGTEVTVVTLTENDEDGNPGFYEFPNLLLDEDYNMGTDGDPATDGLPRYTISVEETQDALTGFMATTADVNGNADDLEDSDSFDGVVAIPTQGEEDTDAEDPATDEAMEASYDFGVIGDLGAIGNYVWVDEDSDGLQDEGEPGIPNVIVQLKDENGIVIATTVTGSNGAYLFPNLPAGDYFVDVDESSLPNAELTQTTIFTNNVDGDDADTVEDDGDLGNKDHSGNGYPITLDAGEENLTADFGYNYNETPDVNEPPMDALAALGDRIWIDSDGDGVQDPDEPGVEGAKLTLSTDLKVINGRLDVNGDGIIDGTDDGTVVGSDGEMYDVFNGFVDLDGSGVLNNDDNDDSALQGGVTIAGFDIIDGRFDIDGNGVDNSEDDGTVFEVGIDMTTTDDNGYYIFNNLPAGVYYVEVTDDDMANYEILNDTNYDQTGDPDHFGESEADNPDDSVEDDNQTTNPVVLAPGDVFLNVDFGYQPEDNLAFISAIGDFVWFDADRDGNGPTLEGVEGGGAIVQGERNGPADENEYGIAGVTVALIKDENSNNVWDAGELIIATDVTDENGFYYFPDLLTSGQAGYNYLIWVSDTDNVLEGLKATSDLDSGSSPLSGTGAPIGQNRNNVLGLSGQSLGSGNPPNAGRLQHDFGYAPMGQSDDEGLIGDYVWFDNDRDGVQDDDEPGVEGVVVELLDDMGNVIATTETNENGYYYFPNLPLDESYQVVIADENFDPNGVLEGFENTFDPDGDMDNEGELITLTAADPINLDQDFGYAGDDSATLGSIGDTVWEDDDADGIRQTDEDPIEGVTLDLYRDLNGDGEINPGEPVIATATTDMNGFYLFDNLPLGDYIVDVTDEAGVLNGYWQSISPNQDASTNGGDDSLDNSKEDAFAVTIGSGEPNDNLNVDFGYYKDLAAVGNFVWNDLNGNGIQDANEPGLEGVVVDLEITYPNGDVVEIATVTDENGFYEFPNLLADEDYNGDGADEPEFVISITTSDQDEAGDVLDGFVPTGTDRGNDDLVDSDNIAGVDAFPVQGNENTTPNANPALEDVIASYDFGFTLLDLVGIAGTVFDDRGQGSATLNDGTQTGDEPGISSVLVQLFNDVGVFITEQLTDENGNYLFTGLPEGDYKITIPASNFSNGGALINLPFSSVPTSTEDDDVDNDDNGIQTSANGMIMSPIITLTAGDEPSGAEETQFPLQDGSNNSTQDVNTNTTIDFGVQDFVLPVELISIKAVAQEDHIDVVWATASEQDNSHFEVERSEDAKSFKYIGLVEGQGTTLERTDYLFEDTEVEAGVTYYYRLKQVDIDGAFEYTDVVSAQLEATDKGEMELYPNPVGTAQMLTVQFFAPELSSELYILDIKGSVVRTVRQDVLNIGWISVQIDVNDLAAGTYFIADSVGNVKEFVKVD